MKEKLHELFLICQSMRIDEFCNLLHQDISFEEKEFYVMLLNYFMQKEQNIIINRSEG